MLATRLAHVITDFELCTAQIETAEAAVPLLKFRGAYLSCSKIALILIASELLLTYALGRVEEAVQHVYYAAPSSDLSHPRSSLAEYLA